MRLIGNLFETWGRWRSAHLFESTHIWQEAAYGRFFIALVLTTQIAMSQVSAGEIGSGSVYGRAVFLASNCGAASEKRQSCNIQEIPAENIEFYCISNEGLGEKTAVTTNADGSFSVRLPNGVYLIAPSNMTRDVIVDGRQIIRVQGKPQQIAVRFLALRS